MTTEPAGPAYLGTRLRHLLDLLDGGVAAVYGDLGLDDYRPRYTPIVRALEELGPSAIRDLARAVAVTHSAASQTVTQMRKSGLVTLKPGADARQRIVHLTPKARALLPVLEAEWAVTTAAAAELDAELPFPLSELVTAAEKALARRPMRARIADSVASMPKPVRERLRGIGA